MDELSTFEFQKILEKNEKTVIILPIGAVEEHGAHLPLNTDSLQPEFITERVVSELREESIDILIAPPIRYGICNATRNFAGTISLSFDTFRAFIQEVLEELGRHGVKHIVVLSGHAGRVHMAALRVAGEAVLEKYPDIKLMLLSDYDIIYKYIDEKFPAWDGHAGSVETSRIMAIKPDLVKEEGELSRVGLPPFMILRSPEKYFPSGVMGDPTAASREQGVEWNDLVVDELKKLITNMLSM
jgi:creatinine amidohydrolase